MDDLDLGATIRGFSPGQKAFNRYTLRKILGRGGMGVVWLARDEELEIDVALKFLPEIVALDKESVAELKRETRRNLGLTHPHIVRVYDFVQGPTTAAISMEYVDGASLSALKLEQPGNVFALEQLRPWLRQLCAALDYAHHSAQIVHRDLKPANLMVNGRGELKITDFGIARSVADSVSRVSAQAGGSSGTPVYMSPQQMMGEDPALTDDIYAAGATLFELLTGKPPFHSGNIMMQVQNKEAPLVNARRAALGGTAPPVSDAWELTIAACLAKDPAARPQSATEVAERLGLSSTSNAGQQTGGAATRSTGSEKTGAEVVGRVVPGSPPLQTPDSKSKTPLYSVLAAGILLLAGLGWYFGVYVPAQDRLQAEAARTAEQARVAEQNRLAEENRLAEANRLTTEKRQAEQHNRTMEQEAHDRVMALIAALPAGAGEAQQAEVRYQVELYEQSAPARFEGQAKARWADWEKAESARLASGSAPRFNVGSAAAAPKQVELGKAQSEQRREAARAAAVRAGRAELVLDGTQKSAFGVPYVLFAADSLRINQDYIGWSTPGVKLATVDVAKAYDEDPDVERANESFRRAESEAQKQVDTLTAQGQMMVDEYKDLIEQADNSALSTAARERARSAAEKKVEQIRLKQTEVKNFTQNTQASLQAQLKNLRDRILARLVTQVADQMRAKGANLVLDLSGPSHLGVPSVVYSDPVYVDGAGGPAVKVGTIDLAKIYEEHWKTREMSAKLKDGEQKVEQQMEKWREVGQLLVEDYKQLIEQSKNSALTTGARQDAETAAQRKMEEIQSKQSEMQAFETNASRSLEQRKRTHRDLMLEEITTVAREIARQSGVTLLMDVSGTGTGGAGLPLVISADPSLDLTGQVQQEINKDRP